MSGSLDTDTLEREVKSMYQDVAESDNADFILEGAANACEKYGVKSISLGATK